MKKLLLAVLFCLVSLFFSFGVSAKDASVSTTRPSISGRLHVAGPHLLDQNGNRAVLRGVSTHGITWYPDFINADFVNTLSEDWDSNIIRLAVYSDVYVKENRQEILQLVKKGIDNAIKADMYVLVDWHTLTEHDPNVYREEAKEFFEAICNAYPNDPHIIYEICNEPNGETTWSDIRDYANVMIPFIRYYSPDSVILVGTPNYDRNLMAAARYPLEYENLMYVLHFYAATHKKDLRHELVDAISRRVPIFISECGLSESSGDDKIDFDSAARWFKILNENDISYCIWSFSNKDEASAITKSNYDPKTPFTDDALTGYGKWAREVIRGRDPYFIPAFDVSVDRSPLDWILRTLRPDEALSVLSWPFILLCGGGTLAVVLFFYLIYKAVRKNRQETYDTLYGAKQNTALAALRTIALLISIFFTLCYLIWRVRFSVPVESGWFAIAANIILLLVEVLGFFESVILYVHLMNMKGHPLPEIADDEYPEVDIFIATYNEPEELLRRTLNGCNHLEYPDKSKVHIWLCDDNRRPSMRALAREMGVGYFDRPDNKGAKAGNLNNALSQTSAPYIVTFDADMIPMSKFLMKTIPYFVHADKLGFVQTPQCFYQPDVFQHALYAEKTAPNEQDFFYRTVEVAKVASNSVIYGGSNTVISRRALDAIGGFYTESITEDFATGLLIESSGFVSLAIPEPLASGMTPNDYAEHLQQRRRWGRGVIGTARKLKIMFRPGLTMAQRLSYLSSTIYWLSPIKTMIYILSPLLFATFAVPVFQCSWADLVLYWVPMFIMQSICLRIMSKGSISLKWSGIYETTVMPHLLLPIILELCGISAKVFEVTTKGGTKARKKRDKRISRPFIILIVLSVIGIFRSLFVLYLTGAVGIVVLLFWIIRNMYYMIMALFLIGGRDSDTEPVRVIDAESILLQRNKKAKPVGPVMEGITTYLTEHGMKIFLDDPVDLEIGDHVSIDIENETAKATVKGVLTGKHIPRSSASCIYSVELTDMEKYPYEYWQILYDRIPTLPQSLKRDMGIIRHILVNIAHRILER